MAKNILIATAGAPALIGSHLTVASQETAALQRLEGLDAMVNKALESFHVPGAAVGIIIDDKVVLTKGYGFRDTERGLAVTENTLFAIGSCTKAFTAHVLGQLADEGKISWDDPVIKYLPEFRLKDEYATYHITLRDLLTHQSGLPRHDLLWYNSDLSRNDLMHRLQYLEPSTDLRGRFQYSNLMYVMAGLVIEKVTGLTWEEAVQSRILTPLAMNRSNFSVLESQKSEDYSLPYREKEGSVASVPFNQIKVAGPAGSINSCVADMVKWVGLQLSDGTFEGRQFLKKETLQTMHTAQVSLRMYPEGTSDYLGYGLGWMIGMHEGRYLVEHGGGIDGFISSTGFLPKEKIGVVVLTNSDSGMMFANSLAMAILDRTLGIAKDDWMEKVKEKEERIKRAFEVKKEPSNEEVLVIAEMARPVNDYIGEFEHPGYGTVHVRKEGDALVLTYHALSIPLSHRCFDHFVGKWQGFGAMNFNCSFTRDPFGEISEVSIPMESAVSGIIFKRKAGSDLLAADYLKQFEGPFESDLFSLHIALKGDQLMAIIPGTAVEYVLISEKPLKFSIKGVPGATALFTSASDEKITEMQFITPNGTFNLKAK